jgi:hypothetical protein
VCDGAADTTGGSSFQVVHHVILGPVVFGRGQKDGSRCRSSGRHGGKMVVVRVVGIVGMLLFNRIFPIRNRCMAAKTRRKQCNCDSRRRREQI